MKRFAVIISLPSIEAEHVTGRFSLLNQAETQFNQDLSDVRDGKYGDKASVTLYQVLRHGGVRES